MEKFEGCSAALLYYLRAMIFEVLQDLDNKDHPRVMKYIRGCYEAAKSLLDIPEPYPSSLAIASVHYSCLRWCRQRLVNTEKVGVDEGTQLTAMEEELETLLMHSFNSHQWPADLHFEPFPLVIDEGREEEVEVFIPNFLLPKKTT